MQSLLKHDATGITLACSDELVLRSANPAFLNLIARLTNINGDRSVAPNTFEDLIGRTYAAVWPADIDPPGLREIKASMRDGQQRDVDWVNITDARGNLFSLRLALCPLVWEEKPAVLILIDDVTQAARANDLAMTIAEEAHRRAEELSTVIMAMVDIVIIFNVQGQAIRSNLAAIETLGIDPAGMDQGELIDLLSIRYENGITIRKEEMPSSQASRGEVVAGERLLLLDKLGAERVFLVSASPLFTESGVSGVVSVWHDVTSRERLLEELEVEQSRLETIIENAPEAILVADEEGRLIRANREAERVLAHKPVFGQNYESLVSLGICHLDGTLYNPRDLPLVSSALDGVRHYHVELLVKLPNGQTRTILSSTAPIIDHKGNLNGAVGILQDITRRKRTEEELRTQADQSRLLATLSQSFAEAGLDHRELLSSIAREISAISGDICAIQLVSGKGEWSSIAAFEHPDGAIKKRVIEETRDLTYAAAEESGSSGQVIRLVDDDPMDAASVLPAQYRILLDYFPIYNGLIVPLRAHGRWIGSLGVFRSEKSKHFMMVDQFFYQDLADRAALAIEDAMLYEYEAQRARELNALQRATSALLSTIDLEELLVQILEAAQQAIPAAEQSALLLLAKETGSLEVRATSGFHEHNLKNISGQHLRRYIDRAAGERKPILINNIPGQNGEDKRLGKQDYSPVRCAIIAPLLIEETVLGVICLTGSQARLFRENDLQILKSFADTATAALRNATLYAEVQRLATTDSLTGQYNRHRFFELGEHEMNRFRRHHNALSAIMMDVDTFKTINDHYGHAGGDQVLIQIGRRVKASIRVIDILGRYGGDEFAILLPDANLDEAKEIAERIRQSITGEPVDTPLGGIPVSISIGVAQAQAEDENLSALFIRADEALYISKQQGRNRVST